MSPDLPTSTPTKQHPNFLINLKTSYLLPIVIAIQNLLADNHCTLLEPHIQPSILEQTAIHLGFQVAFDVDQFEVLDVSQGFYTVQLVVVECVVNCELVVLG